MTENVASVVDPAAENVSASLATAAPRRSSLGFFLGGLLGFLAGGLVASGVFIFVLIVVHQRHRAELAAAAMPGDALNSALGSAMDLAHGSHGEETSAGTTPTVSEEEQVMAFGKAFIGDLEANRLTLAYRQMSADFQQKNERAAFDMLIAKYPTIRSLTQSEYSRTFKTRKSSDGMSWEFYCTAPDYASKLTNFALTLTKTADGGWCVNELEITADGVP